MRSRSGSAALPGLDRLLLGGRDRGIVGVAQHEIAEGAALAGGIDAGLHRLQPQDRAARVLVAQSHEHRGLDAERGRLVACGRIRRDLGHRLPAEMQQPQPDQRVPEPEHGPRRAEREAGEQHHIDPGPAAGAQHLGRRPQHAGVGDDIEREHDLPPPGQLVDGLQPGRCRKAQAWQNGLGHRPAGGTIRRGIETVAHATQVPIVARGGGVTDRGGKMMTRRSTGKTRVARSLWYAKKGVVELRNARLEPPARGEARVRTLFSGISRGTERLVFEGSIGRERVGAHARAAAGGRVPVPCEIRLLRDGHGRGWACRSHGPPGLLPLSASGFLQRSDRGPGAHPRWRAAAQGDTWPPTWRPRSTPCGTAAPAPATASWWWAPASWGCWSHPWRPGCRAPSSPPSTGIKAAARWPKAWAPALPCPPTLPPTPMSCFTPAPPPRASIARLPARASKPRSWR